MKIFYCIPNLYNAGGKERIISAKANWLAAHGHRVTIVTTDQNGKPAFFELNDVRHIDLNVMYSNVVTLNPIKKYFRRKRLIRLHRERLLNLLLREKPDIVVSTFDNEIGFLHSLPDGSKKVMEIHFHRWFRTAGNTKGPLWNIIYRVLSATDLRHLRKYSRFICLTEEDSRNWKGLKNMVVIPNFVTLAPRQQAPLTPRRMIAVGRLSHQKGYERMVDAWSIVAQRHPDWTLDIFGNGPDYEILKLHIRDEGLEKHIHLCGVASHVEQEYLNSSALLLTSHYEGFGLVLVEAMRCGVPAVSFMCPCGPRDIIDDGRTGLLVADGDINALAEAICKLIESPELRKTLGDNAYIKSQEYTPENIMPRWEALFYEIMEPDGSH